MAVGVGMCLCSVYARQLRLAVVASALRTVAVWWRPKQVVGWWLWLLLANAVANDAGLLVRLWVRLGATGCVVVCAATAGTHRPVFGDHCV